MANSPVVSGLPAYVQTNRENLIGKMLFSSRTAKLLTPQLGVKGTAQINLLTTAVTFGNGRACGWDEKGTSTLTYRNIVAGAVKINMAYCDKALIGKYLEQDVRIAAGAKNLPFEEEFIADVIDKLGYAIDVAIWQGDTTSATDNLKYFDGLLKIAGADASVITSSVSSGATYIAAAEQIASAMPVDILDGENAVIFCDPAFARAYKFALVAKNWLHYEPTADANEVVIPGSSIRLIAVPGLASQGKLFGCNLKEVFYGTDGLNDAEVFDFWYSQDNREFRLAIEFTAGVNYAFSDHIVLGTYTTLV